MIGRQPHKPVDRGTARRLDKPEEGMWAVRMARGAPEVGARIYRCWHEPGNPENRMDRSYLVAEINGASVEIDRVWLRRGRPIDRAEYDFLIADRKWAAWHAPDLPEARPDRAVNLNELQPLF